MKYSGYMVSVYWLSLSISTIDFTMHTEINVLILENKITIGILPELLTMYSHTCTYGRPTHTDTHRLRHMFAYDTCTHMHAYVHA